MFIVCSAFVNFKAWRKAPYSSTASRSVIRLSSPKTFCARCNHAGKYESIKED
jgi:hypothetical protein